MTDYIVRAYANEATNCYDTADLNVVSGRVYIAFGCLEMTTSAQTAAEDVAISNLASMVSNITAKGYQVCELRRCTTTDFEDMLDDELAVGVVWFSHGAVVCDPVDTNCQREVSRAWSWGGPGMGDRLWVTDWVARLSSKKLYALWMLTCGSDPSDIFHRACATCSHCGPDICPTHSPAAPGPFVCPYCSNGYLSGGTTNFHSAASPPTTLITFNSERDDMVRTDGWFMGYTLAEPPEPVTPLDGSENAPGHQDSFRDALP